MRTVSCYNKLKFFVSLPLTQILRLSLAGHVSTLIPLVCLFSQVAMIDREGEFVDLHPQAEILAAGLRRLILRAGVCVCPSECAKRARTHSVCADDFMTSASEEE